MSRGFDGFEIDDFRDSGWERDSRCSDREPSRGRGGISATERSTAWKLERLREAERSLDILNRLSQDRSNQTRSALPREGQQRSTLSSPSRAIYTDRDRTYSLRDSEVRTLSEVGRFRVVDTADLAQFAYSGDRSRMERDVQPRASGAGRAARNQCAETGFTPGTRTHQARATPHPASQPRTGRPGHLFWLRQAQRSRS